MCGPGSDGGEADDSAAADGGWPAVAGAGGELHGNLETDKRLQVKTNSSKLKKMCYVIVLNACVIIEKNHDVTNKICG